MLRFRLAALAALFTVSSALAAEPTLHRTFNVSPGGTLTIDADVGDIDITTGGSGVTVDVARRGERARDIEVTFDQQQNNVTVRAKNRVNHWFNWNNSEDMKFTVSIPSRYNLQLRTSGGDIRAGDLQGVAHVKTSGGNIELGRIDGEVDADTSGGSVNLAAARGSINVHTSGGNIHIGNADGPAQVKTSGGSIDIKRVGGDLYARTSGGGISIDDALGTVDASTSGGSVRARLSQQPRADCKLSTSGGSIVVSLAPSVAVDVDAHTSGGDVETDVPVTLLGKQGESSLEGKINGGGPRLVLRSSGGDIRLKKL